ncbi:hypothetical protein ABZS86_36260 [Streptomyces sp. NPDC005355]|uniref:hypothetical protein n=1 Tax=Streptomyces sp. NPDC005355 TaxID=3157038 RepID=UPI0033BC7B8F
MQIWLAKNPPCALPLHPCRLLVAEPDRNLVRNPDPAVHPLRQKPFTSTATADEILAKVRLTQANVKKLVNNNAN